MKWQDYIVVKPDVRSGKPCVIGTRITVTDVLEYLASDMDEAAILVDFPELRHEHIQAVLAFAAERTPPQCAPCIVLKLLFDENLSPRLVRAFADEFPDSSHVTSLGLAGISDHVIWAYARTHGAKMRALGGNSLKRTPS